MEATITVRNLRALKGPIYALLDAEILIAGVPVVVMGIQARHLKAGGTSVHLPTYRDADGAWRAAVILPDEIRDALCDAVLDFMVEEGVAKQAGSGQAEAERDDFGAKLAARRGSIPADADLGI